MAIRERRPVLIRALAATAVASSPAHSHHDRRLPAGELTNALRPFPHDFIASVRRMSSIVGERAPLVDDHRAERSGV